MSSVGSITVLGDQTVKNEPTEILIDPWRGMSYRKREFAPLNKTALLVRLDEIGALGGSARIILDTGDPVLEYELPGVPSDLTGLLTERFFDRWDLVANELTDSIFANPRVTDPATYPLSGLYYNTRVVLARVARMGAGATIKDAVASCNQDKEDGTLTGVSVDGTTTGTNDFAAPTSALAQQYYREIIKDQVEYEAPTHVLTHVSVCSPTSTYDVARANQMCIYSPAQLLSEVSSGWTYNIPPRLYSEIAAIPSNAAPDPETRYYTWGWLKKITRSSPQSNFTIEVSTEYILGLWNNRAYPLAT